MFLRNGLRAIIDRKNEIRIEFDGLIIILGSSVVLAFACIGAAAIDEGPRVAWIKLDYLVVVVDCGVGLSKSYFAASSTLRWYGRVTGEARLPAMKEKPALQATATVAA